LFIQSIVSIAEKPCYEILRDKASD